MTPDDSGEISLQEQAKELGFDSPDALIAAAKKSKSHDAYDGRQSKRLREVEEELAELKIRKQQADLGVGDDADEMSKRFAREILELRSTVSTLTRTLATTPEDKDLEVYYNQVLEQFPEVKLVKDPIRRMEVSRRFARQLKTESESPATQNKGGRDVSEAHLTGGDSPVSRRSSLSEDQAMERYQRDLAKAKGEDAKEEVHAKYRALHPDWGV